MRPLRKVVNGLRFNSSRFYLERFLAEAGAATPAQALLLDAGAGDSRYHHLFAHTRYESTDFYKVDKPYAPVTYICDLTAIPVASERYDCVVCTQVLEHVPEPAAVLRELHRVLKPGGALWLSAPLLYAEHEAPFDFYRYTQFGLRHRLEQAGFQVTRLERMEGYAGALAYELEAAVMTLPLRPADYGGGLIGWAMCGLGLLLRPIFFGLSIVYSRVDARHKSLAGHNKNYVARATKAVAPDRPGGPLATNQAELR